MLPQQLPRLSRHPLPYHMVNPELYTLHEQFASASWCYSAQQAPKGWVQGRRYHHPLDTSAAPSLKGLFYHLSQPEAIHATGPEGCTESSVEGA